MIETLSSPKQGRKSILNIIPQEQKEEEMTTMAQTKSSKHIKHQGARPKNDQDNSCREKLAHLVRDIGCFHEIFAEKFYLVYLAKDEDSKWFCESNAESPNCPFIFWAFYNNPGITYEAFNMDFGPFNLATTHQFCSKLKVYFDTQALRDPDKYLVVVLDDYDTKRKLNATLLVAVAAMVLLGLTDNEVIQRLNFSMTYKGKPGALLEYRKELIFREKKKFTDVSGNHSIMTLTLEDCIRGFYAALQQKFYQYYEFDHAEYLFYETVMSGDLNWIVPGKILAFAGPSDKPVHSKIYHKHPPKFYHHYFTDHNVTTIIRLNEPEYESSGFIDYGFDHHDLIFPDGYPPTSSIAAKFIKIVDEAKGAVAVHCYAGIGRTGTLIAAYLMARYDFTPQMAVAWTRICRPGSVIGEQQDWLFTKFDRCSVNKKQVMPVKSRKTKLSSTTLDSEKQNIESKRDQNPKTTYAIAEKTYGQAKALLLTKKQREDFDRPCTRNSTLLKSLDDGGHASKSTKKTDIVLDLGKTVPLMIYLIDFKDLKPSENPKFYRIKESKYEWKVKFPECGYVALKHNLASVMEAAVACKITFNCLFREPTLDFRYELDKSAIKSVESEEDSRLKPTIYFGFGSIVSNTDRDLFLSQHDDV